MKLEAVVEARILNNVLRAVQTVSDDCLLKFGPDVLGIRVVDASNALMIDLEMPNGVFEQYDADEGVLAIDVSTMFAKTNTFTADTDVRLVWDEFSKKINLSGDGAKWGIRVIDPTTVRKSPNMPNLEVPLNVYISADRFRRMVKKAGVVNDYILIGFGAPEGETEETFYVASESESDDFREDVFGKDITIKSSAIVETMYTLDMLEPVTKTFDGEVSIQLGQDLPIVIDFVMDGVPVTFLLAPRIEKGG